VAGAVTLHSLPLFVRLAGRPVILLGEGPAADAKRRLLQRAGATVSGEEADARLAIVAVEEAANARAAVERLRARGILVNAVDRPELCDFTLPAIVDRDPVLVAIGTGGASAGLAAALRQRLEALLPTSLGGLARALHDAREAMRARWPDGDARRRALGAAMQSGGALDPLTADEESVGRWLGQPDPPHSPFRRFAPSSLSRWEREGPREPKARGKGEGDRIITIRLRSPDPDDLTLREARLLGQADRVYHAPDTPPAILDRARADAVRLCASPPDAPEPGLTIVLEGP
jgi:uroporphyrin-III C-methyltransferase/precorrin-2 dehydrogenase/sirohydrochlorin ferrochelatase